MVKTFGITSLLLCCLLLACGKPSSAQVQGAAGDPQVPGTQAAVFIAALQRGDFTAAVGQFDAQMSAVLSAAKLQEYWQAVQAQSGAYLRQLTPQEETVTQNGVQYTVCLVPCEFQNATVPIKVVIDAQAHVCGLFFLPPKAQPVAYTPADYIDVQRFTEQQVTIHSGTCDLPGMLDIPANVARVPAVVLVHGSGPNDRDETIGPNKPFRDLARGLASRGIAVLRYDKRTLVYPDKFAKAFTIKDEIIDDAVAAAAFLRTQPAVDGKQIYVLGHSLGGFAAPRIARADPQLAGLIILAGAARPLEDILLEQMTYLGSLRGALSPDAQQQLEQIKSQVALIKSPRLMTLAPDTPFLFGAPPAYWRDLRDYQPAQLAKRLPQAMLILQGGRDYQATEEDFQLWKTALATRTDVKLKLFPQLNHLFISGAGKSTPSEYAVAGHVDKTVIEEIAGWINGRNHVLAP